jgi:hypothetical protein
VINFYLAISVLSGHLILFHLHAQRINYAKSRGSASAVAHDNSIKLTGSATCQDSSISGTDLALFDRLNTPNPHAIDPPPKEIWTMTRITSAAPTKLAKDAAMSPAKVAS